jgi:hypothetical protein
MSNTWDMLAKLQIFKMYTKSFWLKVWWLWFHSYIHHKHKIGYNKLVLKISVQKYSLYLKLKYLLHLIYNHTDVIVYESLLWCSEQLLSLKSMPVKKLFQSQFKSRDCHSPDQQCLTHPKIIKPYVGTKQSKTKGVGSGIQFKKETQNISEHTSTYKHTDKLTLELCSITKD